MKKITKIAACVALALSLGLLCSCSVFDIASSSSSSNAGQADYVTRDDMNNIISGIEENITVNAGDNYNINITSDENKNLIAASKGLLSAVSIEAEFSVTTVIPPSLFYPGSTETSVATSGGSGVIYQLDKMKGSAYIITNYHVVYYNGSNNADGISDNIKCYLYGQEYPEYAIPATFIGGSMTYDIAVLEVKNSDVLRESHAVAATFADSNDVSILDTAIAIGNAEGLGISATVGAVNVESEYIQMQSLNGSGYTAFRVMRIDAAVNSGNSGGGLFNDKGEIIGIVNAKITDSTVDNIGYAIPSNVAKYVADNILYYDSIDSENDSVYRAMIGVSVAVESAGINYNTESGKIIKEEVVVVETVSAGGLSDGKLMVNDRIKSVTIDGVDYEIIRTFNVIDVMLTARKTSNVVFHIERNGVDMDVTINMSSATLTEA